MFIAQKKDFNVLSLDSISFSGDQQLFKCTLVGEADLYMSTKMPLITAAFGLSYAFNGKCLILPRP